MKIIQKFPIWFSKQRLSAKIFLVVMGLLLVIGMCSILSIVFTRPEQQSPSITATYQGADGITFMTWTPGPTTSTPTPDGSAIPADSATLTISPTATGTDVPLPTGLPTRSFETATVVRLPATLSPATAGILVLITAVDKQLEYVDIQNAGNPPVNLRGWVLVSETGNQACKLRGILEPKQVLRIWAAKGQVGLSCEFKNPIWLDQELDPAVLYNAKGEEVSRFP